MKRFLNLVEWDAEANGDLNEDAKSYYQAFPKDNPDVLAIHSSYLDNYKNLNDKTMK